MIRQVQQQLEQSSSWASRLTVLAIAVLATNLHASGAPERAFAAGGTALIVGSLMGLGMVAIVVARLMGKNIGLIRSDRQAIVALLVMVAAKIAIARVLLP